MFFKGFELPRKGRLFSGGCMRKITITCSALWVLMSWLVIPVVYSNEQGPIPEAYQLASRLEGAQLYDNWPKINKAEISGSHTLFPGVDPQSAADTWRCVACHGWDYIGSRGNGQDSSQFLRIIGVAGNRNTSIDKVYKIITGRNKEHNFTNYLSEKQLWAVTKFVREGIYNVSQVFTNDGTARGNISKGKALYREFCLQCHGEEASGNNVNGEKAGHEIRSVAKSNPAKTMHKILWGDPGTDMPAMLADGNENFEKAINIVAYLQRLKQ